MDGHWLYETIYQVSHFAPLVIMVAAALDIFFMTGLVLYGIAMLSTVGMMHMSGMISTPELIVSAFVGTIAGNTLNYWTGRLFGGTDYIKKKLERPKIKQAQSFLRTRGLLVFMIIGRFVTFTRPLYALVLGSMQITFHRFLLYELPLALFWVTFWLLILLEGEYLYKLWTS